MRIPFFSKPLQDLKHSPQRDFHGQISVNRNGKKTEDGALCQHQDKTGQEEASVEVQMNADTDGYGKRDGETTDQNISHSQGHQEIVGGVLQGGVDRDRPANQYVAGYGENSDYYFNHDVVRTHLSKVCQRTKVCRLFTEEWVTYNTDASPTGVKKSFCCNPEIFHKCELHKQPSVEEKGLYFLCILSVHIPTIPA